MNILSLRISQDKAAVIFVQMQRVFHHKNRFFKSFRFAKSEQVPVAF